MFQTCIVLVLIVTGYVPALPAERKAVFAGGCFWGVEAVFEHVKGVIDVRSGYAGGTKETANYRDVSSGRTKHAESVEIRFDPEKIAYEQLLFVFFAVAHDPTEVNRQGPDTGPQYRSAIFYSDLSQKRAAETFIAAISNAKVSEKPIATEIVPLVEFFVAEYYHQDYLKNHLDEPYIIAHDLPKLVALREKFPNLYRK